MSTVKHESIKPLKFKHYAFDVQYHPKLNIFVSSHINGDLILWNLKTKKQSWKTVWRLHTSSSSCSSARFFSDGNLIFAGSADRTCSVFDINGAAIWQTPCNRKISHNHAVNVVHPINDNLLVSGDDGGILKIWDLRMNGLVWDYALNDHYVSDITSDLIHHPNSLIVTSGDALAHIDLRKKKLRAMSDPLDYDLLCCKFMRNGTKIVCGTTENGCINVFSWGNFGDCNDRILLNCLSTDVIIPYNYIQNSEIFLAATGVGSVYVVSLFPNKVIGVLNQTSKSSNATHILALNSDKTILATSNDENNLKFYNTSIVDNLVTNFLNAPSHKILSANDDFFSDL